MQGWISIDRKIMSHWVFDDPKDFKAWISILMNVNHESVKKKICGKLTTCERGQSLMSLDSWATIFGRGWNKDKVRRFMKLLESDGMISYEKFSNKSLRITVCNYDTYQSSRNTDATQMQQKNNTDATQMQTNNNDNNGITTNNNEKQTIPYQEIIDLIISIPNAIKPRKITDTHKSDIKARWNKEGKSIDAFKEVVDLCKSSKFLCGEVRPSEGHKQFRISINWILNKKNWDKVISGQYQDQSNNGKTKQKQFKPVEPDWINEV